MIADILVLFGILLATFGMGFVFGVRYMKTERKVVLRRLQAMCR